MARRWRVAVVIPARTCPCRQVDRVLRQLGPQDQLVVVLNRLGSAERCECCRMRHPLITWIDMQRSVGAGCARNLGVSALGDEGAQSLLFCDADDQVTTTWLAELAGPLLESTADVVGGSLKFQQRGGTVVSISPTVDYWHSQALFGGNMGVTFDAWCRLGGFDESFACCEDTDLAWRAGREELRIMVVPDATVEVTLRPTMVEFVQRLRWGRWSVRLLQAHGVPLDHLPGLWILFRHKRASGFATNAVVAAVGQWTGQRIERVSLCTRAAR